VHGLRFVSCFILFLFLLYFVFSYKQLISFLSLSLFLFPQVDERYQKSFTKLCALVSPDKHYRKARQYYSSSPIPKLAPLNILQQEIYLSYENKKYLSEDKKDINFDLLLLLGSCLRTLQEHQSNADFKTAHLTYSRSLMQLLLQWKPDVNEDEMYERSVALFPLGAKTDTNSYASEKPMMRLNASHRNESIDPRLLVKVYSSLKVDEANAITNERRKQFRKKKSLSSLSMRRVSIIMK
jgi:hypothetical protein